ncbi:MAG TPA: HAMP domain-containing protein, partial [Candidatus Angelobacter sp.]|nr:HAMP domain-containing protein [Candidatus Angelobacter sp.]
MSDLPKLEQARMLVKRALRPHSKLGKITLWFGMLALLLQLAKLITRSPNGTMLSGWATFITFIFAVCLLLRGYRWARQAILWRLRNRLIVTYIFIGVIPIVLLISMFLLATYLFAGQFATYVALADLDIELQHLTATNNALAAQFRTLTQQGKLTPQLAAEISNASDEAFSQRTITVLESDRGFVVGPGGTTTEFHEKLPAAVKNELSGFVMDKGRLHMRAVRQVDAGGRKLIVISNVPMTADLLLRAARVGSVDLYPPNSDTESDGPAETADGKPAVARNDTVTIDLGGSKSKVTIAGKDVTNSQQNVEAGRVAPASSRFDPEFRWWTLFTATDWRSGKELTGTMVVGSRPSMLYNVLFGTQGTRALLFIQVLGGIAIFLGLIELVALLIGVRLTRSMTQSVAELYTATQHVNQGDFSHRIQIRTRDQLATLEESFNSMSASLSKLIDEQKEKQRLESELAIAHEVQALLFPGQASGLLGLEVHGVCRPA